MGRREDIGEGGGKGEEGGKTKILGGGGAEEKGGYWREGWEIDRKNGRGDVRKG